MALLPMGAVTAPAAAVTAPVVEPRAAPGTGSGIDDQDTHEPDVPYDVFLWNDPVTLMDMVVRVLSKVFGYDGATAQALMLRAHREGKAVVWSGERERATSYCMRLGRYGLQSTVAKS